MTQRQIEKDPATGQFVAGVSNPDGFRIVGTWWDEDSAKRWCRILMRINPGWLAEPLPVDHKDHYIPPITMRDRKEDNAQAD